MDVNLGKRPTPRTLEPRLGLDSWMRLERSPINPVLLVESTIPLIFGVLPGQIIERAASCFANGCAWWQSDPSALFSELYVASVKVRKYRASMASETPPTCIRNRQINVLPKMLNQTTAMWQEVLALQLKSGISFFITVCTWVPSDKTQALVVAPRKDPETEQERAERPKELLREEAEKAIEAYRKRAKNVESSWHLRKVATLKINGDNDQVCGKRKVLSVLFYDVERAG